MIDTKSKPDHLPIDPQTGKALVPMQQPGYYPGYSTLGQADFWDEATRNVVLKRVHEVPPIRFFTEYEAKVLGAVCDRILPQDDRTPDRRIPIVSHIDARQYERISDGFQFEDMPDDREAMRLGLRAVDGMAEHGFGRRFLDLEPREQEQILKSIHDARPEGANDIWDRMPPGRYWSLLVQFVVEAYYAHPWAWDEIGYGGPAYPRGYMRLAGGMPEPWEVDERRYEWEPPPDSITGENVKPGGEHARHPAPAQSGTH